MFAYAGCAICMAPCHEVRYFNKFLKMNKTRTFMPSLKEQIECIKNMLLPRKTDYYFKSYNVSNIASRVTNNVCNVNGPR